MSWGINPNRTFLFKFSRWSKPMRKLLLKVKQSTAWRVLCRAYARWVEADGNEGAAAFAYYMLLSFLPLVILLVTVGSLFAMIFQLIPWLVLFYGLIMIYRLAPSRATRFSEVWLGALAAMLLIWISEWLFLLYGVHFTSFNALYGALSGMVAFLIWIYLSSCVCVFGICFCTALAEVRDKSDGPLHLTSG